MAISGAKPACFYHPTTVLFLDDNQAFLDAMELEFGNQIKMLTFADPDQAMLAINASNEGINHSVLKPIDKADSDSASTYMAGVELHELRNLFNNESRSDNIAVVVVDYDMPKLNGIEFCEMLADRNIFKIMLTAEADQDTAIKAFNGGSIDKFLLKTSENLYQELSGAITELKNKYFMDSSRTIVDGLGGALSSLLKNDAYRKLFLQVLSEANAVEYYLVDGSGSFLFLDKDAKPTWLIVRHVNEIDEQVELLEGYDSPLSMILPIKNKEKILFLLSENDYKRPIADWMQNVFDAKVLDVDYCYSIVKGELTDAIS